MSRLETIYRDKVVPVLQKEFNYKSSMQVPGIEKKRKKLSLVEGRLLGMARQIVLSEIISVYEINGEKAEELLAKWIKIG